MAYNRRLDVLVRRNLPYVNTFAQLIEESLKHSWRPTLHSMRLADAYDLAMEDVGSTLRAERRPVATSKHRRRG